MRKDDICSHVEGDKGGKGFQEKNGKGIGETDWNGYWREKRKGDLREAQEIIIGGKEGKVCRGGYFLLPNRK
jgi:hypothetical protein